METSIDRVKPQKNDIKLLVMDVDGTLTDGKIYLGNIGELMKAFDIKDGCAIHDILPAYQILPVIITGRNTNILKERCRELNILHLYQGIQDKAEKLEEIITQLGLHYTNIAYIGDDLNDISCMKKVAMIGCPADAAKEVKAIAHFISAKNGGNGAVREFIEWLTEK